jgi:hypothetical protein
VANVHAQEHGVSDMMRMVAAEHARLLLEMLAILEAASFIVASQPLLGSYVATPLAGGEATAAAVRQLAAQKARLEAELVPDLATNVALVWVCTRALPDILRGMLFGCMQAL